MCQWFLPCKAKVLERRLPCGTQSRPPSAPVELTTGSLKAFCITGRQDFPFAGHSVCARKTCMSDWEEKNICTSYIGEIVKEQLILVKILLWNAAKSSGCAVICHVNASLWARASCHIACNLGIWQKTVGRFSSRGTQRILLLMLPAFPLPQAFSRICCITVEMLVSWCPTGGAHGTLFLSMPYLENRSALYEHMHTLCIYFTSLIFSLIAVCILDS